MGHKQPTQRGPAFITVHAGSQEVFVEGVFIAKKNSTDYHKEMNGDIFEKSFRQQLLPNISENKLIVFRQCQMSQSFS